MGLNKETIQEWMLALLVSIVSILLNRILDDDKDRRKQDWNDYTQAHMPLSRDDIDRLIALSKSLEDSKDTVSTQKIKRPVQVPSTDAHTVVNTTTTPTPKPNTCLLYTSDAADE